MRAATAGAVLGLLLAGCNPIVPDGSRVSVTCTRDGRTTYRSPEGDEALLSDRGMWRVLEHDGERYLTIAVFMQLPGEECRSERTEPTP